MFYAVSKYKDIIATSDIGCYTLGMGDPLNIGDTIICMGAGITAAIGFEKAARMGNRKNKIFGFIGDSTFFHSGITGLIDAVYNNSPIVAVILDNSITAMTGHQENPGTGKTLMGEKTQVVDIEKIVRAIGIKPENLRIVDPYNLPETEAAVKEGGSLVVNDYEIYSMPVLMGKVPYPQDVLEKLSEKIKNLKIFNAADTAEKLGNIKTQNIVLLGALIKALGLEKMDWDQVVRDNLPEKMHAINIKALKAGMEI